MMAATRHFAGRAFKCIEPGFWQADDGTTLREEFADGAGTRDNHSWVAERRKGDEIVEHYGEGLSLREAARTIPSGGSVGGRDHHG